MKRDLQGQRETELIAAILAGDARLYYELIHPYKCSIYRLAFVCMKNVKDAEDVAQETFVRAYRDLTVFRGDLKFSAWLIDIALNEAKNRLQRQGTARSACFEEPQSEETPVTPALLRGWRQLPPEAIEQRQIRELLLQAMMALPGMHQRVFVLHDVERLGLEYTARILSIEISSARGSLHRARMLLQRTLAPPLAAINRASANGDEPHR